MRRGLIFEQRLVAEPQRLERARPVVLDQHVGAGDQLLQDFAARLGLEVERDRLLVRPLGQKRGAHVAPVQRAVGAALAALVGLVRVLDLDHVGAEHGQLIGGERAGQHMGDVDDADAFKGSRHAAYSLLGTNRQLVSGVTAGIVARNHFDEGAYAASFARRADCASLPCSLRGARPSRRLRRFRGAVCRDTRPGRAGHRGRPVGCRSGFRFGPRETCRLEPTADTRAADLPPGQIRAAAGRRPTERPDPDGRGGCGGPTAPRPDHRYRHRVARGGGAGRYDPAADQDPLHSARRQHPAHSRHVGHRRSNARRRASAARTSPILCGTRSTICAAGCWSPN